MKLAFLALFCTLMNNQSLWAQGAAFEGSTAEDDFVYYNMGQKYIHGYIGPPNANKFPLVYKPAVIGKAGQTKGHAAGDSDEILAVSNCHTQSSPGDPGPFDDYLGSYSTKLEHMDGGMSVGRYYSSFLTVQYCGLKTVTTSDMLKNSLALLTADPSMQSKLSSSIFENEEEFNLAFYEDNDNDKVTATLKSRCEVKRKKLLKRVVTLENSKCAKKYAHQVNDSAMKKNDLLNSKKSKTEKPENGRTIK